ncbi:MULTISPECIES: DNA/RNA helicase domain-containing protein [Myroides]|uniref:DNA/RNA helicase domain-containing protein n=1 Tax=Myroides TaxID=76831 RepID=UPI0025773056|nr:MULTISPECIES: DNA/RNA helicase domain-containing protein [Myroides]MDM1377660.1 DUF2075 domain-containing protein [Myroides marinus]MDM1385136.1 DUF2075 domain-containing protein [Myroides marinus]MDM1392144.1 DUF2075 domain-containing protein [Myroides marinus]MEC4028569.1 DNA/RNA helicase domain-containing protein [Myroides odoratimimus]
MKFSIQQYPLDDQIENRLIANNREFLNWPLVYFLEEQGAKEAYVGETTDVIQRLKTHSKTEKKQNLDSVNLITSELFNKSATLDIESNLIRYIAADGHYSLQNGNLGISNHTYYNQKEVYWQLFNDIWSELQTLGIARHSLEHIDNSDLFKYSPYKSLSKEQISSLKMILQCLLDDKAKVSLIQGGAGTGKSILAIFLFKLLKTKLDEFNYSDFDEEDENLFSLVKQVREKYGDLNMALVIPMASFRKTITNVFKNVKGLSGKMVIGPSEVVKQQYDLLIVDEGHRLRRRVNLGSYFGTFDKNNEALDLDKMTATELDWIQLQSKKSLIFYDEFQSIKPSDVLKEEFNELKNKTTTRNEKLTTQFRVKGGNNYVGLVHQLFNETDHTIANKNIGFYDFKLFDNLDQMLQEIHKKERTLGLSRMVAGFAWEWISKKKPEAFDIEIGDTKLKWNSTAVDWVNSANAINEVGCIHTTQGYDLNYTGVIIGPELDYDFSTNTFIVHKHLYKDKNGKNSISDDSVLLDYVLNIYKTILLRGIEGTYVYVCNPNLRKYLSQYISNFEANYPTKENKLQIINEPTDYTIPYYDLKIAAGLFSDQQSVEDIQYIEVDLQNRKNYFACKVVGESMNKVIPNGSICLFQKDFVGSRNGLITLVEGLNTIDAELGGNYTIKEYSSKKTTDEDGWKHEEIILKPVSTDFFEPIILRDEETINFKVIGVFIKVLE